MAPTLYYLLIKPLSLLPLPVLYYLSDFLFLVMYKLLTYRKKVVVNNLKASFPDKSPQEIEVLAQQFYRHFCDIIIESVKAFSISKEEVLKRFKLTTPEVLEELYEQKKSVILTCGHYNNWELGSVAFDMQIPHQTVGIYAPLKSSFFNEKLKSSRGKYGMQLVSKEDIKEVFRKNHEDQKMTATGFMIDQSPMSSSKNVYWTRFLNQDTAVRYGAEKYAKEHNYPVVFIYPRKVRRGYYEFSFKVIESDPVSSPHGSITEKHTRELEKQIIEDPQYWLWTHKRWKKKL